MLKNNNLKQLCMVTLVFSLPFFAEEAESVEFNSSMRNYSIVLGASRIVFDAENDTYNLSVENRQSYPVLVETKIMDESSEQKSSAYIVTPPLFRLDGGQKNSVAVIKASNSFTSNVESMNWVCVKSIPPTDGKAWVGDNKGKDKGALNLNVLVNNCIKLIMRPSIVDNIKDASYGEELKWKVNDGRLVVENMTPYYINFSSIKVDNKSTVPPVFVKPKSTYLFDVKYIVKVGTKIHWRLIDDYGAQTRQYESSVTL